MHRATHTFARGGTPAAPASVFHHVLVAADALLLVLPLVALLAQAHRLQVVQQLVQGHLRPRARDRRDPERVTRGGGGGNLGGVPI